MKRLPSKRHHRYRKLVFRLMYFALKRVVVGRYSHDTIDAMVMLQQYALQREHRTPFAIIRALVWKGNGGDIPFCTVTRLGGMANKAAWRALCEKITEQVGKYEGGW